ncbi:amino acid ABC transporter substrate-binding protein [Azospirillum argentinense]|uniref:Amino acid ABC transporter substrate-binding protein n=1 Tax=Azospirillum argentinense TaxID=2970906 RepID=A0A060DFH2_9PROT|nr:amino acid ABC transporter substrate-binding protein [Azospirillum argentinense]EZQ08506.1 amino acid ABC transporter substrate-binding protein [Azospirillum argentinense]
MVSGGKAVRRLSIALSALAFHAALQSMFLVSGTAPVLAESRLDRIQRTGLVRVCMWPDYYAISFRNPYSGELQGLDVDMARALGQDLGTRVSFVESGFSSFIADLLSDRCDIGMFGIGVTAARAEKVAFSQPYLNSGIYAVSSQAHPRILRWDDLDQDGMVVAVQKGTVMDDYASRALRKASVRIVSGPQEREEEVQSGRADAFLTDYPYGQRILSVHQWAHLITPEIPVQSTPYAYAVAPGDPLWLDRVNRFVDAVKRDGRLEAAAARFRLTPIVARD